MSPESRIWEIRPFGSMRGGRESVIGLVPFNPTSPAYSTIFGRFGRYANLRIRQTLRQDLQDEQDGLPAQKRSPNGEALCPMPICFSILYILFILCAAHKAV